MSKIDNFYPLYNQKLSPLIGEDLKFLEIGVQGGSSIKKWRKMSWSWEVHGVDIDENCKGDNIHIGDQLDKNFMKQFEGFDIVIDDGGHTWKQQIETFEQLFPTMRKGALYVIEDLHTSFWNEFADYHISTVDYFLQLVPHLNYKEANDHNRLAGRHPLKNLGIKSIEFYPSIIFITKE